MDSGLMSYIQPFGLLILFFLILYLAYLASRYAGRLQGSLVPGRNMTIIEAISVGPQKTLQIVRVGKTYMVVGVSRDNITYLREINSEELNLQDNALPTAFSSILERMTKGQKDNQLLTGEETDESIEEHEN